MEIFSGWINFGGSGSGTDKAFGIAVDEADNVYITGQMCEINGGINTYTVKYDPAGIKLWEKTYNGTGNGTDKAWGIVVDDDCSIYITGESYESSSYTTNYFTAKYDSNGTAVWGASYNGTGNGSDVATSIGIISNNASIVVTGKSWGTSNNLDYATVRYDKNNGVQTQVNRYSFTQYSSDIAKDLVIGDDGAIYITGYSELLVENSNTISYISTIKLDWGSNMISNQVLPKSFSLYQNYPNPFNPSTSIKFDLREASYVKLAIYDVIGRQVDVLVNQQLNAGTHIISFSANNLSSGIYFYKLEAGSFSDIKKMTLVK